MATAQRREAAHFETSTCSAAESVGSFVYYVAGGDVREVDIDDGSKARAVGIIVQKPTPTTCVVQLSGVVSGLHSGLGVGLPVYAGTDAQATQTPTYPLSGIRWTQVCAVAIASTAIKLEFQNPIGLRPL